MATHQEPEFIRQGRRSREQTKMDLQLRGLWLQSLRGLFTPGLVAAYAKDIIGQVLYESLLRNEVTDGPPWSDLDVDDRMMYEALAEVVLGEFTEVLLATVEAQLGGGGGAD